MGEVGWEAVRAAVRAKVEKALNELPMPRCLYAQKEVLQLLNFAMDHRLAQVVDERKVFLLEHDLEAQDVDSSPNVVFLLRGDPRQMRTLAAMVLRNASKLVTKHYFLCFVPLLDHHCLEELKQLTVLDRFHVKEFDFGELSLAPRLLSLELPPQLSSIDGETLLGDSLLRLTKQLGLWKHLIGKGPRAKRILQRFQERSLQLGADVTDNSFLVVIDRETDFVGALLSGHSYESQLDAQLGIKLNQLQVSDGVFGNGPAEMLLHNPRDPVYSKIAYLPLSQAHAHLQQTSTTLRVKIQEKKEAAEDLQQLNQLKETLMVDFEQVQNHRCLVLHLNELRQHCVQLNALTFEASLLQESEVSLQSLFPLSLFVPPSETLRLLCLASHLSPQDFLGRNLSELLQILLLHYGTQHLHSVHRLMRSRWLREGVAPRWHRLAEVLKLKQQSSYSGSLLGMSPPGIKFIEKILKGTMDTELSLLFHSETYFRNTIPAAPPCSLVVVVYVGPITYTQVACLRAIQSQLQLRLHILTTNLCSPNQIIDGIIHD